MAKTLVIVESPAKAKTLGKYLGSQFKVKASVGHLKDLPKSKMGITIKGGKFTPEYTVIRGKQKVLSDLKKAGETADRILLASDPDREGEAIAWHIAEELRSVNDNIFRVLFNEITKRGVKEAIEKPTTIDKKKFDSQQTRRLLDRIVGYELSPLLWRKVRRGLSAGRVQSVAVRLVVEREEEIKAFVAREYWTIETTLGAKTPPPFGARLMRVSGEKASIETGDVARAIVDELKVLPCVVANVETKERRRNPTPPFTTSKLQQEAARKLRFTAKRTMGIAQKLYEGIELGEEGPTGLITYMRTDSVRTADEALLAVREYVAATYGKENLPDEAIKYKTKKSAQDAHEAIRPTAMEWTPERVKPFLEEPDFKLYQLVWNRFVASQMKPAVYDQTTVDVKAGKYDLRATGSTLKFPGFMSVYMEDADDTAVRDVRDDDEGAHDDALPAVAVGEELNLLEVKPDQHFTEPPPRYTEASLVKELEERGIGRPSTYAAIMSVIVDREYVAKLENRFSPTELGTLVTGLLVKSFPSILDVEFTAQVEERLDDIEEGTVGWQNVLGDFYRPFHEQIQKANVEMRNVKAEEIPTEHVCEKCGKPMVIKWGRNGSFLACQGYPECKNTKEFRRNEDGSIRIVVDEPTNEKCPTCEAPMVLKRGKFGRFYACSRYPECTGRKSISTGVKCPDDGGQGELVEKMSRRGKAFFSCNRYPDCKFALWDRPVARPCPTCGAKFLVQKYTKKFGAQVKCANKECGYVEAAAEAAGEGAEAGAGDSKAAS
ncbi:MAG: type I DNA topoisomerase [Deltaproteobacteria bacterium]|nr:type I DNA topoisomerase [Deltaproteobacteria bacterium]